MISGPPSSRHLLAVKYTHPVGVSTNGGLSIAEDPYLKNRRIRARRLAEARRKGTHTKEEWKAILDEVDGECVRCGSTDYPLEKDHIIPIYQGGSDHITNLQPLCARCNSAKGPDNTNWLEIWRAQSVD